MDPPPEGGGEDGMEPSTSKVLLEGENEDNTQHLPKESDSDDLFMCRVCRGNEGNLYYPCLCTGSIKYVHQECLVEWLKYSKKEVCELCNHKYSFQPIYRQDMPKALPIFDILRGVCISAAGMIKTWVVYTLVMAAWLGAVPLTAARIYNCIFYMSIYEVMYTPSLLVKVENIAQDIMKGSLLLIVFVCTFISLVWLREQIVLGGPHNFLNLDQGNIEHEEQEESEEENDDEEHLMGDDVTGTDDADSNSEDDIEENDNVHRHFEPYIGLEGERDFERERDEILQREIADMQGHGEEPIPPRRLIHEDFDDMRDDENEIVDENPQPAGPEPPRRIRRPRQQRDEEQAENEENWRDWERFGDELTWQRLLGLDGSLIFLEHVFWVISLNTVFTVIFAYAPYRIGYWKLSLLGLQNKITYYPSIVAMLSGYVIIASIVFLLHKVCEVLKFRQAYRFLGIMFLIIKVFLLVVTEIGFFPIMCGCWMDLCTLPLFNASLSQRVGTFISSPFMSIFLHWMIGMVYVFYSASFVILLREILRPGVLWFMRNLNDPDFNPIQEMIDLPFVKHFRRLMVSTTLFFTTILLIFYIPLKIIHKMIPSALPYNVSTSADTPLSELSLELLILQVVMPAILEHANGRKHIKTAVRFWCRAVGKLLNLDRYLLSDNNNNNAQDRPPAAAALVAGGGLAAEHQALLLLREPRAYEPYERPNFFPLRIAFLLLSMALTTILCSILFFIIPSSIGRITILLSSGQSNTHEIYTVGLGMYICWLVGKGVLLIYKFATGGPEIVRQAIINYSYLILRIFAVAVPMVLLMPLLMGSYFQLVFLAPLRLGYQQTPLNFPYQDWAMGVVQMKIFAVVAMMGPDWWLKTELDLILQRGLENFAAVHMLFRIVLPCSLFLGGMIAFPVVAVKFYSVTMSLDHESAMLHLRFGYPVFLCITLAYIFVCWQITKFSELTEKIKNDRYLVGTQLVNYEKNGTRSK